MIKSLRYRAGKRGRKEKEEEEEENRSTCTHRVLWGRQEIRVYHKRISRYC